MNLPLRQWALSQTLLIAAMLAPSITCVVSAQDQQVVQPNEKATAVSVKPGINDSFLDPNLDVDQFISRFEVESREIFASRDRVLEALDLKAGMAVADVGAGTGFYSIAIAWKIGPKGQVYAVDIAPKFVEHIRNLSENLGRDNISPVLCDGNSVRLAPESVDMAFSSDVYHHFEYPQLTLASIHRALKPGGKWIVIDFERIEGVSRDWTMQHVRAGKEVVIKEVEQAGFQFVGEKKIEGFSENYFIEFVKK